MPWNTDRPLDADRVRTLISARWPDLAAGEVKYFAEGWDSQVYEAGEWLFRFPKRAEVEADYAVETALLPELAAHLAAHGAGVRVPVFECHGTASELFPYRFAGYRKLSGRQVDELAGVPLEPFARQLGRALTALHAFPPDRARALGVPEDMASRQLEPMRTRALVNLPKVETSLGPRLFARVQAALELPPPPDHGGARVLVHNDLLHAHLLVDDAHALSGIIDWSDAGIGDPAVDFVGLFAWGGEGFSDAALAHYHGAVDAGFRTRVRYRALCVGVFCAVYADAENDEHERAFARQALERALRG